MFGGRSFAPISARGTRASRIARAPRTCRSDRCSVERIRRPSSPSPSSRSTSSRLAASVSAREGVAQQVEGLPEPTAQHGRHVVRRDVLPPPREGLQLVHLAHQATEVLPHLGEQLAERVRGEAEPTGPQLGLDVRAQGPPLLRRRVVDGRLREELFQALPPPVGLRGRAGRASRPARDPPTSRPRAGSRPRRPCVLQRSARRTTIARRETKSDPVRAAPRTSSHFFSSP